MHVLSLEKVPASLILITVALLSSPVAHSGGLCEGLEGRHLLIRGNGFEGKTRILSLEKRIGDSYLFRTEVTFAGEPTDPMTGECRDRHISFVRKRAGVFEQTYDGWIFERGGKEMAGMITAEGGQTRWGWYGRIVPP